MMASGVIFGTLEEQDRDDKMYEVILETIRGHILEEWTDWWECSCSEDIEGDTEEEAVENHQKHLAEVILKDLEDSQSEHHILIDESEDMVAWAIQHSMFCRLQGKLLDCKYTRAASKGIVDLTRSGKFKCSVTDDGFLKVGEIIDV